MEEAVITALPDKTTIPCDTSGPSAAAPPWNLEPENKVCIARSLVHICFVGTRKLHQTKRLLLRLSYPSCCFDGWLIFANAILCLALQIAQTISFKQLFPRDIVA